MTKRNKINILLILIYMYLLSLINTQQYTKEKSMKVNSNFYITGSLTTKEITSKNLDGTGNVEILKKIEAENIKIDSLISNTILVENIIPEDGKLILNGDIVVINDLIGDNININGDSFTLNDWMIIEHDDFESKDSLNGWNDKRINKCKGSNNTHLGGYCNFAGNEVTKIFEHLPKHNKLRINALYHMLDLWNGEIGYMKVDGNIKWSKKGISKQNGFNYCGNESNDPDFNIKIDIILDHNKDNVVISFGSTLKGDPCLHSFGIDDVMIYTK